METVEYKDEATVQIPISGFQIQESSLDLVVNDCGSDQSREEEKWNKHIEDLLVLWRAQCMSDMTTHTQAATWNRRKHILLSVPNITLSIVMAGTTASIAESPLKNYIATAGFIVTGCLSGVSAFFEFGAKADLHNRYSFLFQRLASEITIELNKSRRFRTAADVFVTRIHAAHMDLLAQAP